MALTFKLAGMDRVISSLNKEINKIEGRTESGLRIAATFVKNEAIKITPIDTGNLRGSAYIESGKNYSGPWAVVGFSADYAVYVHEINKNYNRGQWKYLESVFRGERARILQIISERVRIR